MIDNNDKNSDNKERIASLLADGQHAGNALLEDFHALYKEYQRLERLSEKLQKENERFRIQLTEVSRSLELASRIDGMTGLANRRDIMERIENEASRSHRHQHFFSLLLIDIDHFKKINEAHGYNAGDDVIVEISRVLRGCLRSEDICSRWGGEIFLILLPETGVEGSLTVADKVLESISMTEFKANKPGIRITASIGICEQGPHQDINECISRADKALQQAKLLGRNRYSIATI